MGWSHGFTTHEALVAELMHRNANYVVVDSALTSFGRHLWTVVENKSTGDRFVCLDLIEKWDGSWGYKPLSEHERPFYYDCPVRLLALAGEPSSELAAKWRKDVAEYRAKKTAKFKAGDKVALYGKTYEVMSKDKKSYMVREAETGRVYKMTPKNFASCALVA